MLNEYRAILFHVLGEGLKMWKKYGFLDQITYGQQLHNALDLITQMHRKQERSFGEENGQKYLHDSRFLQCEISLNYVIFS